MNKMISWLDKKIYPTVTDNWDNTLFGNFIRSWCNPSHVALDLGAGAGIIESMNFKNHFGTVYGIDLDKRIKNNPHLHAAKIGNIENLPYKDQTFNLVFSTNVLEHLNKPEMVFKEVYRILKPGGYFITKTPNQYHYVPITARLTHDSFHRTINRLRGRKEVDTFPTFYKINTIKNQKKIARSCGFEIYSIKTYEGRPEYLRIHIVPYIFGILYEKIVNSSSLFSNFRIIIISTFKKPLQMNL
jgi:ubiquinone/menaquinone biosynthesis C-methylase UbiE